MLVCGHFWINIVYISDITVKNMTLRYNETDVPNQETTYMCQMFDLEDITTDFHVIAYQPYIDNQHVMHHIIIVD